MAFLRFSRDKRGYEHFYLVQPSHRGKARPRVLYWFRTPPNIKVGRSPFDPEMRRALEAQNPDVAFDWERIVQTPIPPPMEPERWRERRRVERAQRAAEADEAESIAAAGPSSRAETATQMAQAIEEPAFVLPAAEAGDISQTAEPAATSNLPSSAPPATTEGGALRQGRRRRRRGRRRPPVQGSGLQVQAPEESPAAEVPESQAPDGRGDEI